MLKRFLLILLSIIMVLSTGCSTGKNIEPKENEPLVENVNNLNLIIDPRIELLSVIMYLSPTYNTSIHAIIPQDITYKKDVDEWFGKYKDHEAVKLFDSMKHCGYSYDAPPTTMLYLTNTPCLKIRDDIDKTDSMYIENIQRAGGESLFKRFIQALNNFCESSNFYDFYNSQKDYYQKVLNSTMDTFKKINYKSQLEDYYGTKQNSYNIIFSGMLYANLYGPSVKTLDGKYDIYSIQGSSGAENDMPNWGSEDDYKHLVSHEFSHSFVNAITDKNIKEVDKYAGLFTPIKEIMEKQAYPEWEICVDEHLVRAAVIRMMTIKEGQSAGEQIMGEDQNQGFVYIDEIVNLLETEYEPNRDKYPTFESFYPEILKLFDSLNNNL